MILHGPGFPDDVWIGGSMDIMADNAAASFVFIPEIISIYHMKPVKIFADHYPVLHGVVPESGTVSRNFPAEKLPVMTGKAELIGVFSPAVTGLIHVIVFYGKGFGQEIFVLASMGRMAYHASIIPGGRLMRKLQFHDFLPDILQHSGLPVFRHLNFPIMTA